MRRKKDVQDVSRAGEWMSLDDVEVWDANPRLNDGKPTEALMRSMRRYGFVAPVVLWLRPDGTRRLVAGHTRLKALRALLAKKPDFVARHTPGVGMVPVRVIPFASESEANEYALLDNRLSELSEWDAAGLAAVVKGLADFTTKLDIGWSAKELREIAEWAPTSWDDAASGMPAGDREPFQQMTFTLHDSQAVRVKRALKIAHERGATHAQNTNSNGNALAAIVDAYLATVGE